MPKIRGTQRKSAMKGYTDNGYSIYDTSPGGGTCCCPPACWTRSLACCGSRPDVPGVPMSDVVECQLQCGSTNIDGTYAGTELSGDCMDNCVAGVIY